MSLAANAGENVSDLRYDSRCGTRPPSLTAASPPDMVLVEVTDVGTTGMAGMRATSWIVTG